MDGQLSRCEHCGLLAPPGARFCCFGCELAAEVAREGREEHGRLYGTLTFTLVLSMVVMMLSLFLYAEDVFDMQGEPELAWLREAYRWASLALATPVLALCGWPLWRSALATLRRRRLSMDALILAGAAAAYGLSAHAVLTGRPGVYFESATAALVLATLGRYLEATARSKASGALGPLLELTRATVTRLDAPGAPPLAPHELTAGERIVVPPFQATPVALELLDEVAEVDLAVLTGEARPVAFRKGERVPAGAVAGASPLRGVALERAEHSAVARLAALARELGERRAGVLRWADRFAAALTPVAWAVALGAAGYGWYAASAGEGVVRALAVVLAACPCSYAIASPLVHWLALRRALGEGLLLRGPDTLEALATARAVALDKTGTLTSATPAVVACELAPGVDAAQVRGLIAALEEGSVHPMGRALLAWAKDPKPEALLTAPPVTPSEVEGGGQARSPLDFARGERGPSALTERRTVSPPVTPSEVEGGGEARSPLDFARGERGPSALTERRTVSPSTSLGETGGVEAKDAQGRRLFAGARGDGQLGLWRGEQRLARFTLAEQLRPGAREAVLALRGLGLSVEVLSGDAAERVRAAAEPLEVSWRAGLSAAQKAARLAELGPDTFMVGDGLNDAPALAAGAAGVSLAGAATLAKGVAQVTLLEDDLRKLPWAISLARGAVRRVRALLVASTAYNLAFVALAASGALRPVWAGLSMLTSSLLALAYAAATARPAPGSVTPAAPAAAPAQVQPC